MDRVREYCRLLGLFALASLLPVLITLCTLALVPLTWIFVRAGHGFGAGVLFLCCAGLAAMWCWNIFRTFRAEKESRLGPGDSPELHDLITEAAESWKGPDVHDLTLRLSWDVGLEVRPVLGVLGWSRFRWGFGVLPLLALSPRELECLIAWDMAYWSRQHGWLNLELKRLWMFWKRHCIRGREVARNKRHSHSEEDDWIFGSFQKFADWIFRRLNPFALDQCFLADRSVSNHFGPRLLSTALLRWALVQPMLSLEVFRNWDTSESQPEEPLQVVTRFLGRWPTDAWDILDLALDDIYGNGPGLLRPRLANLEIEPFIPVPSHVDSAVSLLGEGGGMRVGDLAAEWAEGTARWAEEVEASKERDRLRRQELEAWIQTGEATSGDELEWLQLSKDKEEADTLLLKLEDFLARYPSQADAIMLRAWVNFRRGDKAAMEQDLSRLVELNPFNLPYVHGLRADVLRLEGLEHQSRVEAGRAKRMAEEVRWAREERSSFTLGDPVEDHQEPEAVVAKIRAFLETVPAVRKAYLVRKQVQHFTERPLLILAVVAKGPFAFGREAFQVRLRDRLVAECPFPEHATGWVIQLGSSLWKRSMDPRKVEGALIYTR